MQTLTPQLPQQRHYGNRHNRSILQTGSKSFAAAARLLPHSMREATAAVYAFCRVADDAVDLQSDPHQALDLLRHRLDLIYRRTPHDDPVDRAFCETVHRHRIPRAIPEALLEGFAWDNEGRRYETLEALIDYCARVASTVGLMMTLAMERRNPVILARAADLGVAIQLTNIARDVGKDARLERLYLPQTDLREAGVDPDAFVRAPQFSPGIGQVVKKLVETANGLYRRAETGIGALPRSCQTAIMAARMIYADVGRVVAERGYDSVTQRAHVSTARKVRLVLLARRAIPHLGALDPAPPITDLCLDPS